jgi:DNA-binding SARP family transcriptional activator
VNDTRLEFLVLGPLEVRVDGVSVRIGGAKQRALLAMLLLSANRPVSRERLIGELRGEQDLDASDHALRVQVWRLRKTLAPDNGEPRLLSRAPGYLLRVEPDELDLERFQKQVEAGRAALEAGDPAHAASLLRGAEALWR